MESDKTTMEFKDLLISILKSYYQRYSKWPSKTRLLKLAYLTDLFYKRRFGTRLLSDTWIYYLYGPYITDYDSVLSASEFKLEEVELEDEKTASIVELNQDIQPRSHSTDINTVIYHVVSEFGNKPFMELLDYIYFETEPMINATERREPLDFTIVQPEESYRVRRLTLDPKIERDLRKRFRERVKRIQNGKRDS